MTECVAAHGCITCGDVATPMRVIELDRARGLALCSDCSDPLLARARVETALVEPVTPGEILLVHAGTALGRAAEQEPDPARHAHAEQSPDAAMPSGARKGARA